MLQTLANEFIISDACANKLIEQLTTNNDFVMNLIYKIWNRKFMFLQKYEKYLANTIDYIVNDYKHDLKNIQKTKKRKQKDSFNPTTAKQFNESLNLITPEELEIKLNECNSIYEYQIYFIKKEQTDSYVVIATNLVNAIFTFKKRFKNFKDQIRTYTLLLNACQLKLDDVVRRMGTYIAYTNYRVNYTQIENDDATTGTEVFTQRSGISV